MFYSGHGSDSLGRDSVPTQDPLSPRPGGPTSSLLPSGLLPNPRLATVDGEALGPLRLSTPGSPWTSRRVPGTRLDWDERSGGWAVDEESDSCGSVPRGRNSKKVLRHCLGVNDSFRLRKILLFNSTRREREGGGRGGGGVGRDASTSSVSW